MSDTTRDGDPRNDEETTAGHEVEEHLVIEGGYDERGPFQEAQIEVREQGHAREEFWIATWIFQRHGEPAWNFMNTRVEGCLGLWWAEHVLAKSGQDNFRLLGAVSICRHAYAALESVMPKSDVGVPR